MCARLDGLDGKLATDLCSLLLTLETQAVEMYNGKSITAVPNRLAINT
jgi:hypothetical protein